MAFTSFVDLGCTCPYYMRLIDLVDLIEFPISIVVFGRRREAANTLQDS